MSFVKVKGTYDVLPSESKKWQALEDYVRYLFNLYNYEEIRTPIMEYKEVIHRESEQSDTVTKETYNFKDKVIVISHFVQKVLQVLLEVM